MKIQTPSGSAEETPVSPAISEPPGGHGSGELSCGLLLLLGEVTKLSVMLAEANEEEFRAAQGRLEMLQAMVANLPSAPAQRRRIGFQPKRKNPKRKR